MIEPMADLIRFFKRYELTILLFLVVLLVTGEFSFTVTPASIAVGLFLDILRRIYLDKERPPTDSRPNRLITLALIGALIVFAGYLAYLYIYVW